MGFTLYGILAALAMAALLGITWLEGRGRGVHYGSFIRFGVIAIVLAFLCSRAVYCLSSTAYYLEELSMPHPELMLQVRDGGYSMLGAMIGVILAALLTEKWQKLPAGTLLDAAALAMPAAIIIERLAEPLCDMGWGKWYQSPVFSFLEELTEGMHPVYLYEAVAAAAILVGLRMLKRSMKQPGDLLLAFLLLYGCTQTVLESMLDSSHMKVIHFVRINQVAAIVMAVIPLILWSLRYAKASAGNGSRIAASWALAGVCILSGVVQEFGVEGAENPYFNVVIVGAVLAGLLAAAAAWWCLSWRSVGMKRILPAAVAALLAVALAVIDRVTDVGDHRLLVLYGIMGADLFLLGWIGFSFRQAAEDILQRQRIADKYGLVPPLAQNGHSEV